HTPTLHSFPTRRSSDLDHAWHRTPGCFNRFAQKPFGRCGIAFSREQEVDRLPCRVERSIQVFVLALHLYIGLVEPITLVGRLQIDRKSTRLTPVTVKSR